MATKRRVGNPNSKLNFRRSENQPTEAKGRRPLREPTTVQHVLVMMILQLCRKVLFVDTNIKVCIYAAALFVVSLLADIFPVPKTYFSRSDNVMNLYFVKFGWAWTLMLTTPFLILTSYTYCCGKREKVGHHLVRLGIATAAWFVWTKLFNYIENNYGRCSVSGKQYNLKHTCLAAGYFWHGFDISGHTFILIYSSLVIIEEARAINGWEGIKDLIRDENHIRTTSEELPNCNALRGLNDEEFTTLKLSYEKFTPYVRSLLISMTCLLLLWDVMLVSTILYYHRMIEKFISGAIAIFSWYVTYRYWFKIPKVLPDLPGDGLFKYRDLKQTKEIPLKRRPGSMSDTKGQLPRFMGMPLYGLKTQDKLNTESNADDIGLIGNETNMTTATKTKV